MFDGQVFVMWLFIKDIIFVTPWIGYSNESP